MKLAADPAALRERYVAARPFPHIVLDGLFQEEVLDRVLAEFPRPGEIEWAAFDNPTEKKLGYRYTTPLKPYLRDFLYEMNSAPVLEFLEALTGIDGLIPDPYFGGAGPHQILPGGFLKVHADFNWHPKLRLDRRLNLLVYLNRDWKEEYGGHLELWDREVTRSEQKILPLFNRTVVFSTTDFSFHGHPDAARLPAGDDPQVGLLLLLQQRPPGRGAVGARTTRSSRRPTTPIGSRAASWRDLARPAVWSLGRGGPSIAGPSACTGCLRRSRPPARPAGARVARVSAQTEVARQAVAGVHLTLFLLSLDLDLALFGLGAAPRTTPIS